MRVTKFNSRKEILLRTNKYLIDWQNDGASKLEKQFRDLIKPYWFHQVVLFQLRIPGSLLRIDFVNCNKKIAVEINGGQHETYNKHFHRGSRLVWIEHIKRDLQKREWCEENNIQVLELEQEDLDRFSPQYIEKNYGVNII
jgi:very-short-patch-repair endonuclease